MILVLSSLNKYAKTLLLNKWIAYACHSKVKQLNSLALVSAGFSCFVFFLRPKERIVVCILHGYG